MKSRRRYSAKTRDSSRRWHIPPPLLHGSEPLEGGQILGEWESALGFVFWQTFRDTLLWTTTDPAQRADTFAESARGADAIEAILDRVDDERVVSALQQLAELVRRPSKVREENVSRACRWISEWAAERGSLQTALAFAQTSALASRNDASAAFWVATNAARTNDHARAEVWYRRSVGLARRAKDWRMYSRAFGGLGRLYMRRGNMPAAWELHHRALRGARRGGMRREQAAALHDLFIVAIETSSALEAERLARQALEAYGRRSGRVHALAHDVAYYWMENGYFARALPVFQAVLPHIDKPVERLIVLGNIVRAAGGSGDVAVAHKAAAEVTELSTDGDLHRGGGRAFLEVARGFATLHDWDRAQAAASRAVLFAERFRESKVRFAAEAILDSIKKPAEFDETIPSRESTPAERTAAESLAADFVRALERVDVGSGR